MKKRNDTMPTRDELAQELNTLQNDLAFLEGRFALLVEYVLERDQIKSRDQLARALRGECE